MNPIVSAALAVDADAISKLPDAELLVLADAVSAEIGEEIVKADQREVAVEKTLAADLDADFRGDLDLAVDAVLDGVDAEVLTADEASAVVEDVGVLMRIRDTSKTLDLLAGALAAIAVLARKATRSVLIDRGWLNSSGRRGELTVAASLSQPDADAIASLAGQQLFWIGEFWDKHLSARIAATVRREALELGLGPEDVGRVLKGVVSGDFPAAAVPGTYRGSSESYFRGLAGTVRNHASTIGSLGAMGDAGFERYRIVAVNDERTTEVCRLMHGRQFSVSSGRAQVARMLAAEDPEAVKRVAGWKSESEVVSAIGDGDAASQERGLVAAGLALPPYHMNCRTVITPV